MNQSRETESENLRNEGLTDDLSFFGKQDWMRFKPKVDMCLWERKKHYFFFGKKFLKDRLRKLSGKMWQESILVYLLH